MKPSYIRQGYRRFLYGASALVMSISTAVAVYTPKAFAATSSTDVSDDGSTQSDNPLYSTYGWQPMGVADDTGTCPTGGTCNATEVLDVYMKFHVTDIPYGSTINSVTLNMYVYENGSKDTGKVYRSYHTDWEEEGLTHAGAPGFNKEAPLANLGDTTDDQEDWINISLPASSVKGSGIYSFTVSSDSQDDAWFATNHSYLQPTLTIDYTAPATTPSYVEIDNADDVQSVINNAPSGSTFLFKAGLYRLVGLDLRSGDSYVAEPGTILNGSILLPTSSWTRDGSLTRWYASGPTSYRGASSGECDFLDRCNYMDELFYNSQRLKQVDTLSEVNDDHWFYDYTANRIYIGREPDWPAASRIELSNYQFALWGVGESNVTLKNFEVLKYASPSQDGPVKINNYHMVDNVTAMFNHGVGFNIVGSNSTVQNSFAIKNGKSGVGAAGSNNTFNNVEIGHNNTAGFAWGWDAGGSKFAFSNYLTVKNSYVHDNYGPGLWTDIDNDNTLYENNTVVNHPGPGIFHEISYDAVIRNNTVKNNGHGFTEWIWGAGIQVANGNGVEVYGNTVEGNAKAIVGSCQNRSPWDFDNFNVHDNVVINSGQTSVAQDYACGVYTTKNVDFENNDYYGNVEWGWNDAVRSWSEWQGYGHDDTGSYTP